MARPDYRSTQAAEYRHWYNSARWKGPHGRRAEQLAREPLCRMCAAEGRVTAGTVADHIIPHRGDPRLFWEGELQTLCDALPWRCHSSRKQKIETLGYEPGCDLAGRPKDIGHPWNRPKARAGG
jgi:5-methylcytosine-specific restriction endonuclease McrA